MHFMNTPYTPTGTVCVLLTQIMANIIEVIWYQTVKWEKLPTMSLEELPMAWGLHYIW